MFKWPVRVYYEDTDCGGVVYHSNYLKFMEQARTEWLRSLGLEQDVLMAEYGVVFAVKSLSIDYIKPALFNQALTIETEIEKMGKVSIVFKQLIYCDSYQNNSDVVIKKERLSKERLSKEQLSSATVKIVSLAYDQQLKKILGPKRLPTEIYQKIVKG